MLLMPGFRFEVTQGLRATLVMELFAYNVSLHRTQDMSRRNPTAHSIHRFWAWGLVLNMISYFLKSANSERNPTRQATMQIKKPPPNSIRVPYCAESDAYKRVSHDQDMILLLERSEQKASKQCRRNSILIPINTVLWP